EALYQTVEHGPLGQVPAERLRVTMKVFVPEHMDFARRAQGVEQQSEVAGFRDGGVGQRRTGAPPDDLALSDSVGNNDRPALIGVVRQKNRRLAVPVAGRRHLNGAPARERREQLRLIFLPNGSRQRFTLDFRMGQIHPGRTSGGYDFSAPAYEFVQGIFFLKRRSTKR